MSVCAVDVVIELFRVQHTDVFVLEGQKFAVDRIHRDFVQGSVFPFSIF